ncbi:hypothetical protein CFBP6109_00968 [Pseudomonas syringae pv. cerasicola]|nr:hypothetical protein CFBP6109_00968 [Pseudomonas syringae pv. cerasicola]SPF16725.1 hypothetical protein PSCFBP6110_04261 [Pseudomonas syringae pv. cerasicola]
MCETDQYVLRQVFCGFRGAVALQVSRAGDDIQQATAQRAGMQGRVRQHADSNGNIGALLKQVDEPVITVEFQFDIRVTLTKLRHMRHDAMQHER